MTKQELFGLQYHDEEDGAVADETGYATEVTFVLSLTLECECDFGPENVNRRKTFVGFYFVDGSHLFVNNI